MNWSSDVVSSRGCCILIYWEKSIFKNNVRFRKMELLCLNYGQYCAHAKLDEIGNLYLYGPNDGTT